MNVVIEELKQRITAIVAKVRRYQGRVDSYRQKRLFENNQRQSCRELDQEEERCGDDQSVAEESKQFWRNIWSQSAYHKKDARWLQDVRSEVNAGAPPCKFLCGVYVNLVPLILDNIRTLAKALQKQNS